MRLVVDTGVFSAALSWRRRTDLEHHVELLTGNQIYLAASTVAELDMARWSPSGVHPDVLSWSGPLPQVLNWAMRREIVFRNIASVVELPASSRPANEGRPLTLDRGIDTFSGRGGSEGS